MEDNILKYLISSLLIMAILFSCSKREVQNHRIESVENIAVSFFVDSLLYKQGLFTDVTHGSLVGERLPPPFEIDLYVNGLFKGYKLYVSKWASNLTQPFIDSITYSNSIFEYHENDIHHFRKIETRFKSESNKADSVLIYIKDPLVEIELKSDSQLDFNSNLVMVVHRALFVEDKNYVQINFLNYYDFPFYEEYVLYIVLNKTKDVEYWFFN